MLKIRLKRLGRKKRACYKIILIDSRKKRDGKSIKEMGFYNPLNKQHQIDIISIQEEVKKGAQLTKTIKNLVAINYK
uniref:Small ribosomal subunit protein bS16c n=1 Tax=Ophidocladus simpliciusculus TaxID=1261574 RepID=A0A1Z1MK01_9FLOR|nr:ribosomal protein S16 [Ophidocladus simpliciusculus]ARW66091.1 ribosomal protein S16 [Ophidocladus simpliciusculus]